MSLDANAVDLDPRGFELLAHGALNNVRVRLVAERDDLIAVPDRIGHRGTEHWPRRVTKITNQGSFDTHDELLLNAIALQPTRVEQHVQIRPTVPDAKPTPGCSGGARD